MSNSIHHSVIIFNIFKKFNLCSLYTEVVIKHLISIIVAVFMRGYRGKTTDFQLCSNCHRTTISHFLNNGKWNDKQLEDTLKNSVVSIIYNEALNSGKPIYVIVDDTITSKTKPLSKALHPIEDAYFHQSHLKKKQDYGHQAVSVMLSCNGITLNYAFVMYDKSISKIEIIKNIADELPVAPVVSYFLCDCWYTSKKVIESFLNKGFYTVSAVKTNRIIYPADVKQQIKAFSAYIDKSDTNVSLVTVGKRQYYVYRYEGKINDFNDVVILISFPKNDFGNSKALRAFLSTNIGLSTQEILDIYLIRWEIEVFFRQCKDKLAIDKYQIRKSLGIKRYWLIMSFVHFVCCTCTGELCSFEEGYKYFSEQIRIEKHKFIYDCGKYNIPFEDVLASIA